jgi:tRNA-2-methylthio-N6-dimethylallyladenosine synthase
VSEAAFDNAFVFKYSPRKGTPAATMPDPIRQDVIEERHGAYSNGSMGSDEEKYRRAVGKRVQILRRGTKPQNPARLEGRTRTNKIVIFEGSERHRAQLLDVDVTRAGWFTLYADAAILNDEMTKSK